jgi:hypothetical protein
MIFYYKIYFYFFIIFNFKTFYCESACDVDNPYETSSCRDGDGGDTWTTCLQRCYWGSAIQTPDSQFTALSNFSIECDGSNWKQVGSDSYSNWCDGETINVNCLDDIIYDPCTGELYQTPDDATYYSYWYGDLDSSKAWIGLTCDDANSEVTDLELNEYKIGQLSPCDLDNIDLTDLDHLEKINLSKNSIIGSIPSWIGAMSSLAELYLGRNSFSGSLPSELQNTPHLVTFEAYRNSITGTLPLLTDTLTYVDLGNNLMTGPLPEIEALTSLQYIDISNNDITGVMPDLGHMPLATVLLQSNRLSGALIGLDGSGMADLEEIDVTSNSLNGTIPAAVTFLDTLDIAHFADNFFSGFLPTLPASLIQYSFYGDNTSYLCPFPDNHPAWLALDCTCGAGWYCPHIPPDSYFAATFGQGQAGCEYNCTACPVGTFGTEEWQTNCTNCEIGTYADTVASTGCDDCEVGTYTNQTGTETCPLCPKGKVTATERTVDCEPCDVGFYADTAGLEVCVSCPLGSITKFTGSHNCEECPVGTYGVNNTHCLPCPAGSYANNTGTVNCTLCAIGSYNPDERRSRPCADCLTGTYGPTVGLTECTDCEVGKYAAEVGHGDEGCDDCERGMAQNKTGADSCFECGPGKLPDDDAINCKYCPAGKEGPDLASERYIILNGVVIYCDACDRGKYSLQGAVTCTTCDDGYVAEEEGQRNCTACPAGTAATSSSHCTDCPTGQYGNTTALDKCPPCPDGFIAVNEGSKMCRRCPAGTYWHSKTGDFSISDGWTLACSNCTIGTYYDGNAPTTNINACPDCPVGRYTDNIAQVVCDICDVGTYMNDTGATMCYDCPKGTYLNDSATAATLHDEVSDCHTCVGGTYNNITGQQYCANCPRGRYIQEEHDNITSHDDVSDCNFCPTGRYGETGGLSVCSSCASGKYLDSVGSVSSSSCDDCDAGTFSAVRAASSCEACPGLKYQSNTGSSYCNTVLQGYYYVGASSDPAACASGYYTDEDGQRNCSACAAGYTSSKSPNEASTGCRICGVGTFSDSAGSADCDDFPAGYASNDTGRTAVVPSTDACNSGYYAPSTGAAFCTIAPAGKYVPTPADGVYTAYSAAISCPAGTYSDTTGATSCTTCPAGYRCSSGSSNPISCNPGYYSEGGVSSCTKCAKGSYQPNTGSTSCILCPTGYYKSTTGSSTTCTACPYLTVAVANGSSACGSCPTNTFPNEILAATGCMGQCEEGYIAASYTDDGAANCEICPIDTYQADTANGAGECIECPEGYEASEGATSCSLIPTDDDTPTQMVAGFDLNQPTQAGSFYSVVGALCLIFLCAIILGAQHCISKRNDQRRAHEKMSRVSKGIWDEEVLLSIPEDNLGGREKVEPPSDNPYMLIKSKRLKSRSARRAVEGAFVEEGLKESPPLGCQGFVVVAASVPVRVSPNLSARQMCTKYRGDVVYTVGAADGWVQLHESHGESHGGEGWIPVRKNPNRIAAGVSPLTHDGHHQAGGVRMFAAKMARMARNNGNSYMSVLDQDGFTPLKDSQVEAEVYLEPLMKNVPLLTTQKPSEDNDKGRKWTKAALREKKKTGNADKLTGQRRRATVVLSAVSESFGLSSNKHLRSKKATKGWWVSLSSSLGMFADDDDEDHENLDGDDSDDEHATLMNKKKEKPRAGYIDDEEREVTTAVLAARANVSVIRVTEMTNMPTEISPPPSSHLPPAADRLTRPPIDIPEPPEYEGLIVSSNGVIDVTQTFPMVGVNDDKEYELVDEDEGTSTLGLFDEFKYEVVVKTLDVKTLPNPNSATKRTLYKGDIVSAVESRHGWLKLAEKGNGAGGNGWLCLKQKTRDHHRLKGSQQQQASSSSSDAQGLLPPAYSESGNKNSSFKNMKSPSSNTLSPKSSKRKSMFQGAMNALSKVNAKSMVNFNDPDFYNEEDNIGDNNENENLLSSNSHKNNEYQPTVVFIDDKKASSKSLLARKKSTNKRRSIVNFGGVSHFNESKDHMNEKDQDTSTQQKWSMPKRVAVVRVSNEVPVKASEDNVLPPPLYTPSSTLSSASSSLEPSSSTSPTSSFMPPPPPPPSEGLPAVFALFKVNTEAALSATAALPGAALDTTLGGADVLNDLLPLDLPLAPQPCPAALSLIDLDTLPAYVRDQFKRKVMDKSQLEMLLEAARNDPALVAASLAAKERVAKANKEGILL